MRGKKSLPTQKTSLADTEKLAYIKTRLSSRMGGFLYLL